MVGKFSIRTFVLASVLVATGALSSNVFAAPPFIEDSPANTLRTNPQEESKYKTTVRKVLKGDLDLPSTRGPFENYFNRYKFPMLTLSDPESIKKLPAERNLFFREFLESSSDANAHEALCQLLLAYMTKVADGNYHPAVRYNAVMMIAQVNGTEVSRSGLTGITLADPHPNALQPMLEWLKAEDTLDLVRLGSLLGIVRHLEMDNYRAAGSKMKADQRTDVLNTLKQLIAQKSPPAYRNEDGQIWMRRKAVEGLGYAMISQADPSLVGVLDAVVNDESDSLEVRSAAATAFGRVNWSAGGVKYDAEAGTKKFGKLVADIFQQESELLAAQRKYEETRIGPVGAATGGAGGGGGLSFAPPGGRLAADPYGLSGAAGLEPLDPKAFRVTASRRQLRMLLQGVEFAILGKDDRANSKGLPAEPRGLIFISQANPKAKQAVDNLQAEIKKLAIFLEEDTEGLGTVDYEEKLLAMADLTTATLAPEAAAPAPAAPAVPGPGEPPLDAIPGELAPGEVPLDEPGAAPAPVVPRPMVPGAAPMPQIPMPGEPVLPPPGEGPGDIPAAP